MANDDIKIGIKLDTTGVMRGINAMSARLDKFASTVDFSLPQMKLPMEGANFSGFWRNIDTSGKKLEKLGLVIGGKVHKSYKQVARAAVEANRAFLRNQQSVDDVNKKFGSFWSGVGEGIPLTGKLRMAFNSARTATKGWGKELAKLNSRLGMIGWRVGLTGLIMMFSLQMIQRVIESTVRSVWNLIKAFSDWRAGISQTVDGMTKMAIAGILSGQNLQMMNDNLGWWLEDGLKVSGEVAKVEGAFTRMGQTVVSALLPYLEQIGDVLVDIAQDPEFKAFLNEVVTIIGDEVTPAFKTLKDEILTEDFKNAIKDIARIVGELGAEFLKALPWVVQTISDFTWLFGVIKPAIPYVAKLLAVFMVLWPILYIGGAVIQLVTTLFGGLVSAVRITIKAAGYLWQAITFLAHGGFGVLITKVKTFLLTSNLVKYAVNAWSWFSKSLMTILKVSWGGIKSFAGVTYKAIGFAFGGMGKILKGFGRFMLSTLSTLGKGNVRFGRTTFMAMGPIGIALMAVVAILTILAVAYEKNLGGFRDFVNNMVKGFGWLGGQFVGFIRWITGLWTGFIDSLLGGAKWIFEKVGVDISGITSGISAALNSLIDGAAKAFSTAATWVASGVDQLSEAASGAWNTVSPMLNDFLGGILPINNELEDMNMNLDELDTSIPELNFGEFGGGGGGGVGNGSEYGGDTNIDTVEINFPSVSGDINDPKTQEEIRRMIAEAFRRVERR